MYLYFSSYIFAICKRIWSMDGRRRRNWVHEVRANWSPIRFSICRVPLRIIMCIVVESYALRQSGRISVAHHLIYPLRWRRCRMNCMRCESNEYNDDELTKTTAIITLTISTENRMALPQTFVSEPNSLPVAHCGRSVRRRQWLQNKKETKIERLVHNMSVCMYVFLFTIIHSTKRTKQKNFS